MCGRYVFYDENNQQLKKIIASAKEKMPEKEFNEISLFEVFPGQKALAAVYDAKRAQVRIKVMKWGFVQGTRSVINARSETCFNSLFFADAVPCAVPASAYFEWTADHQKYSFTADNETIYLGGLAKEHSDGWYFIIITEPASGMQKEIHDRQPLVFTYQDAKKWCASKHPTSLLSHSLQERSSTKV